MICALLLLDAPAPAGDHERLSFVLAVLLNLAAVAFGAGIVWAKLEALTRDYREFRQRVEAELRKD